jgi:hypothetical protein
MRSKTKAKPTKARKANALAGRPTFYGTPMTACVYVDFTVEQAKAIANFCRVRWFGVSPFVREVALEAAGLPCLGVLSARKLVAPKIAEPKGTISRPVTCSEEQRAGIAAAAESRGMTTATFIRWAVLSYVRRTDLMTGAPE